jgi:DNA polymerase-3 subunit epsilon
MFSEPVVYVDIETTGGSYRSSRIIEIAMIRVENDEVVDTFKTLINPGSPIPHHITRLTGISTTDVADAPFFEEVAEQIHSILLGAVFIAHHVRFDYSFIKRQLEICNIRYNPRMLCSVRMSRALYPEERGHGLEAIINRFNIQTHARHRAYDDAEAVRTFLKIAFEQHGPEVFSASVNKQLKHRSMPPNLDSGAFDSIPDTPGVYTFSDADGSPIYIGKSVTLRKRIMSHFAQDTAVDKEMKLSLNTHKVSFIQTANELEALLLESQMVKQQLPMYNRQLRRHKKMYVLKNSQNEQGYNTITIAFVDNTDITPGNQIYGAYASKMKAKHALENLQKTYDLCPKLLGLEKAGGPCFKSQLRRCRGACFMNEAATLYNQRFETAFKYSKIDAWPYKQPIVVAHVGSGDQKTLVIDNWNVIGELRSEEGCDTHYKPWQSVFDIDTYRIIRSYLANKSSLLKLQPITYGELESLGI